MNHRQRIVAGVAGAAVLGAALAAVSPVAGHTLFKRQLQRRYPGLTVKCEACHIKGKPKEEINDFGRLFNEQMAGAELTARWKELENEDRRAFELEVMKPAFLAALDQIKQQVNADGISWGELLDTGKIPNTKLKKGVQHASDGAIPDDAPEEPWDEEEDSSDSPKQPPPAERGSETPPAEGSPPAGNSGGEEKPEPAPGSGNPATGDSGSGNSGGGGSGTSGSGSSPSGGSSSGGTQGGNPPGGGR